MLLPPHRHPVLAPDVVLRDPLGWQGLGLGLLGFLLHSAILKKPTTRPTATRTTIAASAMLIGDYFTQATILAFMVTYYSTW